MGSVFRLVGLVVASLLSIASVAQGEQPPRLGQAEKEALTNRKRDETIEQLKRIIPKIDERSAQKADLLYQLSELYWEKSKILLRQELDAYEQSYGSYQAARSRGEKREAPKEDHGESRSYRAEAMRLYEIILRDYPAYERKDEVLFSLAENLYDAGKHQQAVSYYQELLRDYPGSKFSADAYIQLGNHYFEVENNLARARHHYQKALASNVPKIHSYALYKLAWCDYNAGQFDAALRKLQQVVNFAETRGTEMVDLKNEALNDMVPVFVRLDRSDEAISYFEAKAGAKRKRKLIAGIAAQLADAGRYQKAISAYQYLIAQAPNQPDAPEFQQAIVRSYEGMRQRDRVKEEIQRLVRGYGPGSSWWSANEGNKEIQRNAFSLAEEAMRTLVTDYHQEAQRTKQVETYRLSRDIYRQYLEAFASSPDGKLVSDHALNMRFYYAEIFWALEEWQPAAEQYQAVVEFKVPDRESAREVTDEKYRKTAAYNAILAYDKLVKVDRGQLAKSELKSGQKVDPAKGKGSLEQTTRIEKRSAKDAQEDPLTDHEEKLVAACDQYNRLFPGAADEIELRYLAAMVLYQRRHFLGAAQRFAEIIGKWPEEGRSQEAADLTMHILETRGEWLELNKLSQQFLSNPKLAKPGSEFAQRVASVVEGSRYKWVDEVVYRREKNPGLAAEEFLRFAREFPRSENAARALTSAMLIFNEAHQLDRGISAGERMLKEHRGSPFELKVRYTLARMYEGAAEFQKAVAMYESFVAAFDQASAKEPTAATSATGAGKGPAAQTAVDPSERQQLLEEAEKWVADAQYNAGLWWDALGHPDRAVAAYRAYIARFKDRKDVPEIQYQIASLYERSKRWREAIKALDEFNTAFARDRRTTPAQHYLATYRQLLAHLKLEDAREWARLTGELVRSFARLPEPAKADDAVMKAYAHARFLALEPLWKSYLEIRFARVSTIRRDLAAKQKKLKEVEKAYADVLAIGSGEHGIAALTRIGMAYGDLAQNIVASPSPPALTGDQLEMYRGELQNRAQPLEEQAVQALEKAIQKASELSIYDDWMFIAQERVNKYRPGSYAGVRHIPLIGSESVATAPLQTDAAIAGELKPAPASSAALAVPNVGSKGNSK